MKVIKIPVGEPAQLVDIPNNLTALQELVGGSIELLQSGAEPDVGLLVDEEGKLKGLPFNFWHSIWKHLHGTVVFVGIDADGFCDVPKRIIEDLIEEEEE